MHSFYVPTWQCSIKCSTFPSSYWSDLSLIAVLYGWLCELAIWSKSYVLTDSNYSFHITKNSWKNIKIKGYLLGICVVSSYSINYLSFLFFTSFLFCFSCIYVQQLGQYPAILSDLPVTLGNENCSLLYFIFFCFISCFLL